MITGSLCASLTFDHEVLAHRSGCHRYHSCPSDNGSYVCGDLGYDSQCPDKQQVSPSSNSKSKIKTGDTEDNSKQNKIAKTCIDGYHLNRKKTLCVPDKKPDTGPELSSNKIENTNFTTSIQCQGVADCFEGTVTEVVDGDTLDVNNVRIRLALVNTPEINELGYSEAKQFVESTCGIGTHAKVDEDDGQKGGSFGRMIGLVYCGNSPMSLNEALLNSTHANMLQKFCSVSEFSSLDWAIKYGC